MRCNLRNTTDGEVWARQFRERLEVQLERNPDTSDPQLLDMLRAWFANAIETGRSAGWAEGMREVHEAGRKIDQTEDNVNVVLEFDRVRWNIIEIIGTIK